MGLQDNDGIHPCLGSPQPRRVRAGDIHTNGIESFWSILKRAYMGTFHWLSPKHLQRYLDEFCWRTNARSLGTLERMELTAAGMVGRRLTYRELVADNGRSSVAEQRVPLVAIRVPSSPTAPGE